MLKGGAQFISLYKEALDIDDPCANFVTLSTLDSGGSPHSRVLTIRSINESAIGVDVNDVSPKMTELANNDKWELSGFWPKRMVQFRIRGSFSTKRPQTLAESWQVKNPHSRLADIYHAQVRSQSSEINDRDQLLSEISALSKTANLNEMPASITALEFHPSFYEIWIGSLEDRLHERTLHTLKDGSWETQVLVP